MKKFETFNHIIEITSNLINQYEFLCRARTKAKYFSREGKIGFVNLISFMLNLVKKTFKRNLMTILSLSKVTKAELPNKYFLKHEKNCHINPLKNYTT